MSSVARPRALPSRTGSSAAARSGASGTACGRTGATNSDEASLFLQHDLAVEIPRSGGGRGKVDRATDGGMTGERDLGSGKEDAHAGGVGGVCRSLHEDRLGQVEFARKGQHLRRRQVIGTKDDRQGIAGEGAVGEDVAGVEGQHEPLQDPSELVTSRLTATSGSVDNIGQSVRARVVLRPASRRRCRRQPLPAGGRGWGSRRGGCLPG